MQLLVPLSVQCQELDEGSTNVSLNSDGHRRPRCTLRAIIGAFRKSSLTEYTAGEHVPAGRSSGRQLALEALRLLLLGLRGFPCLLSCS